jgi:hypothetical protein
MISSHPVNHMRKIFLTALIALSCVVVVSAQRRGDLCHVYVVDVETARKAFESLRETGRDISGLATGQTLFPEFRSVLGEEELTTKTYPFPGNKLVITASVFYTDESMASSEGVDSMLIGVVVSEKAQKDAISSESNAVAEITMNQRDTVRTRKYLRINGRLYLVGMECRCKEGKQ